jgi:hypothetical protein
MEPTIVILATLEGRWLVRNAQVISSLDAWREMHPRLRACAIDRASVALRARRRNLSNRVLSTQKNAAIERLRQNCVTLLKQLGNGRSAVSRIRLAWALSPDSFARSREFGVRGCSPAYADFWRCVRWSAFHPPPSHK